MIQRHQSLEHSFQELKSIYAYDSYLKRLLRVKELLDQRKLNCRDVYRNSEENHLCIRQILSQGRLPNFCEGILS